MATAQQLIERALTKIQVKGAETPLTTTELDDGLIVLNQMAAELEQEGFELYTGGYSVLALGDTVPIPDYALNFYTLQLAGRLAPEYLEAGVPAFLPDLIQGARRIVVRVLNSKAVGTVGTLQNLLNSAIEVLNAKSASEPLTTSELENAIPKYNDLVNELAAEGFETGATQATTLTDSHNISDYAVAWYKVQIAARLAPSYGVELNETIAGQMQQGRRASVREQNRRAVGVSGTYRNLVYGAFELSNAKGADFPITSSEMTNAIYRLNDFIATLESKGFRLSYQIADGSNLDAAHGLPDWSWSWIKAGLAARLASSYGVPLNETIMAMIADGERAAYARFGTIPKVEYPDTLPIGSSRWYETEFFSNEAYDDLQVSQGGTLLDDEGDPLERNA